MRSMCAWISLHRIMIREWAWLVRCTSSWHRERGVEVHSHIFFCGPRKTLSRKELRAPDLADFGKILSCKKLRLRSLESRR
jgi:hypothetical protein